MQPACKRFLFPLLCFFFRKGLHVFFFLIYRPLNRTSKTQQLHSHSSQKMVARAIPFEARNVKSKLIACFVSLVPKQGSRGCRKMQGFYFITLPSSIIVVNGPVRLNEFNCCRSQLVLKTITKRQFSVLHQLRLMKCRSVPALLNFR